LNETLRPSALTIAGSDSSGGAGIQADLKTFMALRVHGASVITALTAQNTQGVSAVHLTPPEHISAQMEAVFSDLRVAAAKTGMLGGEEQIDAVATGLERRAGDIPIVVDPVMAATTGARLLEPGAERALISRLLPLAALVTPNLREAAILLGEPEARDEDAMRWQAMALYRLGAQKVLLKGGHLPGAEAVDILFEGAELIALRKPRIETRNPHRTGCTLSAAIAAGLAKGLPSREAAIKAKEFLHRALQAADAFRIGHGHGPVDHLSAAFDG
jgi:hydroxymethylpyrimidine/phosphomethylpyrimidine kinase